MKCKQKQKLNIIFESLPGEHEVPSEHARDAGDLLLLVHSVVVGNIGLKVERDPPGDPEDSEDVREELAEAVSTWSVWTGGPLSAPPSE